MDYENYNGITTGPETNPYPQYDRFKTYRSMSPQEKNNTFVRLMKFRVNNNHSTLLEKDRGFERLIFSFLTFEGSSLGRQNVSVNTIFIRISNDGNLLVDTDSKSLFQISYLEDVKQDIRVFYKRTTTETPDFEVEIYLNIPLAYQKLNVQPIIFDQIYPVISNYNPHMSTRFSKYTNLNTLLRDFTSFVPLSEQEMIDNLGDGYVQYKSIISRDVKVTTFSGTSTSVNLDKNAEVLRIASNGIIGDLKTIIPFYGEDFYGKKIICECWNDNTTLVSNSMSALDDNNTNKIILKGGTSRLLKKGEVFSLVYLQKKWLEV